MRKGGTSDPKGDAKREDRLLLSAENHNYPGKSKSFFLMGEKGNDAGGPAWGISVKREGEKRFI